MNCQNCGAPIPEGTKFCPACGAQQTAPQPQEAPQEAASSFCASCGNPVPAGATFCAVCGQPVGAAAPSKPKLNKKLLIGIGAAVAVIALVVVLIVVLAGGGSNSPEGVAERFVKATSEMDYETLLDCYTDAALRQISGSDEGTSRSAMIKEAMASMKEESGGLDFSEFIKGMKIECEVKEVITDKDDKDLEEFINNVEDGQYGFTEKELKSIDDYALVTIKVSTSIPLFGSPTENVPCVKMDGTWYVAGQPITNGDFGTDEISFDTEDFSFDTSDFSFDF